MEFFTQSKPLLSFHLYSFFSLFFPSPVVHLKENPECLPPSFPWGEMSAQTVNLWGFLLSYINIPGCWVEIKGKLLREREREMEQWNSFSLIFAFWQGQMLKGLGFVDRPNRWTFSNSSPLFTYFSAGEFRHNGRRNIFSSNRWKESECEKREWDWHGVGWDQKEEMSVMYVSDFEVG